MEYNKPILTTFGSIRQITSQKYVETAADNVKDKLTKNDGGYESPLLVKHGHMSEITGNQPPDPCSQVNPPPWC